MNKNEKRLADRKFGSKLESILLRWGTLTLGVGLFLALIVFWVVLFGFVAVAISLFA